MNRVLSRYCHKRFCPPSFAAFCCCLLLPPQEINIIVAALFVMELREECLFSCVFFFLSEVVTSVPQEQWICSWLKTYCLLSFKNIIDWKCQWPWVPLIYQSYFSCALFWKHADLLIAFKIKLYCAAASIPWISCNKFICGTCLTTVSEKKKSIACASWPLS